jgi:hypothetical protein
VRSSGLMQMDGLHHCWRRSRGGYGRPLFLSQHRHLPRFLYYLPLPFPPSAGRPVVKLCRTPGPLPPGGRQLPLADALWLAQCCWKQLPFARAICPLSCCILVRFADADRGTARDVLQCTILPK